MDDMLDPTETIHQHGCNGAVAMGARGHKLTWGQASVSMNFSSGANGWLAGHTTFAAQDQVQQGTLTMCSILGQTCKYEMQCMLLSCPLFWSPNGRVPRSKESQTRPCSPCPESQFHLNLLACPLHCHPLYCIHYIPPTQSIAQMYAHTSFHQAHPT